MSDLDAERIVRMGERGEIDVSDLAWNPATKKPVEVEATPMPAPFEVETPEGTMEGEQGDVLIRGVEGELYPCDSGVFAQSYTLEESHECTNCGQTIGPLKYEMIGDDKTHHVNYCSGCGTPIHEALHG